MTGGWPTSRLHGRCAHLGHRPALFRCCSHLAKRLKSEGHYIVGCGEPWARCADRTFRRCSPLSHCRSATTHLPPACLTCRLEAQRAHAGEQAASSGSGGWRRAAAAAASRAVCRHLHAAYSRGTMIVREKVNSSSRHAGGAVGCCLHALTACSFPTGDVTVSMPGRPSTLQEEVFCDEFILVDLRVFDNCRKVRGRRALPPPWRRFALLPKLLQRAPSVGPHPALRHAVTACRLSRAATTCSTWPPTWAAWASSSPTTRSSCTTTP